ncbi:unnamed protein product [Caenorhabditis brenneri]
MVLRDHRSRSSSRDSHDSQSSSLGRKTAGRPKHAERADSSELVKAARTAISTLQVLTPEQDGYQNYLVKADELLVSIKKHAHKLASLRNYVAKKFDTPFMEASANREKYLQEVNATIAKAKAGILLKELQIIGGTIEAQLNSLKFQCSQYSPSDGILSDEEVPTGKKLVNAPSLFAPAQASSSNFETYGINSVNAQPNTGTGAELEPSSSVIETPILPMANRSEPDIANYESAIEGDSHQKDMEIIQNLRAQLEEERSRRREEQAEAAKTEAAYVKSYTQLQDLCLSAQDRANRAQSRLQTAQSTAPAAMMQPAVAPAAAPVATSQPADAPAAPVQQSVPAPTVDAVPNQNMTAGTGNFQHPDLHVLADAIKSMHQERLQSNTGMTAMAASMEKLISFMSDWRREQEEEKYADEYERHAQGTGAQDAPPPAQEAEIPKMVPVPNEAQFYCRFDATRHLSDYDGSGDLDVFQSTFERVVMEDDKLSNSDRYLLLRKLLKGSAADCITHADEPKLAIKKTFTALVRAFGHSQTENNLLGKLNRLPFHQSDPKQMRLDMVNITVVMERLKQKGIPENDKRTIWDIASKLPPAIQNDVTDYLAEHEDTVTHDSLVDMIFARIKALDMKSIIRAQGSSLASNEIPDSYGSINHVNASQPASAQAGSSSVRRPAPKTESFRSKGLRPLAYKADALPVEYVDPVTRQILPGYYTPGPRGAHIGAHPYCLLAHDGKRPNHTNRILY